MFWECHIVSSSIDKLLDQPSDTLKLQDFLDENDLIQECLSQNKRLIDYLVQPSVMNELIGHIIKLPTDDSFRNAHVVSELLSGDFQRVQERLIEKEHLDLLYSFLLSHPIDDQSTLNPILASYFSRILLALIIRRPNELFNYLKTRETFRDDVLQHLYSTAIIDVLFRLVADSGEQRSEAIRWYEEINLVDGLIQQLLTTQSPYVQMNIVNLLCEFLRLAFDQHNGMENDMQDIANGAFSSSSIEHLLYNRSENEESSSNPFSLENGTDKKSKNAETDEKITPLILAQHILSKSNLERFFDALTKQQTLVANGCEFLVNVFDLLGRYIPASICISLTTPSQEKSSSKDESSSSDKDENEHMQINDEGDSPDGTKINERTFNVPNTNTSANLTVYAKDPLVRIYIILLEVIPSRLSSLVALLSTPSAPLISSSSSSSPSHESSQTVKYQFISEPLGAMRLNLIKFFSKLLHIISNDYTGDHIYQIFDSSRLLNVLIDLFHHHIYNNFLHTQVYSIIRLLFHISSLSVKQPNDIWTRTPLKNQTESFESELPSTSPFHHTNRCFYKLFQSLLSISDVNLIERLLDQYELNVASSKSILTTSSSDDAISTSLLHTRFASPNSGHVAQILRCLREHASTFNNYSSVFKTDEQQQIDENTNLLEIRWQTALDYLAEDEKKWSAMHHNERESDNSFRITSAASIMAHFNNTINSSDVTEASQRRQTFHTRSFGSSGAPYIDDDDDDDVQQFDIDDELMNNEQTTNGRRVADMQNISFDPQFPPVFDEHTLWHQEENISTTKTLEGNGDDHNLTRTSTTPLPDLFENYRIDQDKSAASTESNFEQLCSLRANDHGGGSVIFPFQSSTSSSSSSKIHDEADNGDDEY